MNLEADHRVDHTYINEFLQGPRLAGVREI